MLIQLQLLHIGSLHVNFPLAEDMKGGHMGPRREGGGIINPPKKGGEAQTLGLFGMQGLMQYAMSCCDVQ